jgi:hypothetical protein
MIRSLRSLIVALIVFSPVVASAQTIGVEFGATRDQLIGTIKTDCGCGFDEGDGTGYRAAIAFEQSLGLGFSVGLKTGFDQKNIAATVAYTDTAIVQGNDGNTYLEALNLSRKLDVSISYATAMPFVEYSVPAIGVFLQTGMTAAIPVKSSLNITRHLDQTSIISDGHSITDMQFQNGSTTEPIDTEDPISNLNSPQYFASAMLGDEIDIVGAKFVVAVTYDLPLTDVRTTDSWRITSIGAVLGMKFDIK